MQVHGNRCFFPIGTPHRRLTCRKEARPSCAFDAGYFIFYKGSFPIYVDFLHYKSWIRSSLGFVPSSFLFFHFFVLNLFFCLFESFYRENERPHACECCWSFSVDLFFLWYLVLELVPTIYCASACACACVRVCVCVSALAHLLSAAQAHYEQSKNAEVKVKKSNPHTL